MQNHPVARLFTAVLIFGAGVGASVAPARAGAAPPVRILLVGDSTTIGSVPRELNPGAPQLEGMMEGLAAAQGLPAIEVVNAGKGGETADRLLGSTWYDQAVAPVAAVDVVILRMGINDWFRCQDFDADFPVQMKALIAQLQEDHPDAEVVLATICRYMKTEDCEQVNAAIGRVADDTGLALFDLYTPYNAYLTEHGPNRLNVRQMRLDEIPEGYHGLLEPYTSFRKGWGNKPDGMVVKVDGTALDPVVGHVPGWYGDRHPNSEGYHLIAVESVRFLAPGLRARAAAAGRVPAASE